MKTCCFDNCPSKLRHRRQGVSFHEFPGSEEIRKKWVKVVRTARLEPRWNPTSASRVCSLHFSSGQFLSKRVLHARAVPSPKCQLPSFIRGRKRSAEPEPDLTDLENDIPDASMGFPSDAMDDTANDADSMESTAAAAVLVQMANQYGEGSSAPAGEKIEVAQVETAGAVVGAGKPVVNVTELIDNAANLNKELAFAQFIEIPPPSEETAENLKTPGENPANSAAEADSPVVLTGNLFNFGDNSTISADSSLPRSDNSVGLDDFEISGNHAVISPEVLEAFEASSNALLVGTAELLNEAFDDQLTQSFPE